MMSNDTTPQVANVDEEADDTVRGALAPTGSDKRVDFLPSERLGSTPDVPASAVTGAAQEGLLTEGMGTGSEDGTPAEEMDAAALDALGEDVSGKEVAEALRNA